MHSIHNAHTHTHRCSMWVCVGGGVLFTLLFVDFLCCLLDFLKYLFLRWMCRHVAGGGKVWPFKTRLKSEQSPSVMWPTCAMQKCACPCSSWRPTRPCLSTSPLYACLRMLQSETEVACYQQRLRLVSVTQVLLLLMLQIIPPLSLFFHPSRSSTFKRSDFIMN